MRYRHQSRKRLYREPFGAVKCRSTVTLRLRIDTEGGQIKTVRLHYAYGIKAFEFGSQLMELHSNSAVAQRLYFQTTVHMPWERALLFYWFEVQSNDGCCYLTPEGGSGGSEIRVSPFAPEIRPHSEPQPAVWQISVYEDNFSNPTWFSGKIMYQIFPDRFNRGKSWTREQMYEAEVRSDRLYHENWNEDVDFRGKPETGYLACDFFGGTLKGIEEKLPDLAEMGISVIYLNPIFKARSNHRYDTGDYECIDPMLGTTEDFCTLCSEAEKLGIHLILDGVFSHTGADSRYFNKYSHYPSVGAWQEACHAQTSPYSSWYSFGPGRTYESWWGFPELPSVKETDLAFSAYISGSDGVIRKWLREGASGWRLDVSDELPDSFIRGVRTAMKAEREDSILLGEIWEDASNKISYGSYRDFLLGASHDCAMGYPFQRAVINWLSGRCSTADLRAQLESTYENYPLPAIHNNMNLISSHDSARAITQLAGAHDPGNREAQARIYLNQEERILGERRLLLALFLQLTLPGVAAIYYGDELAMEGYRDPFNRRTYAHDSVGGDFNLRYRKVLKIAKDFPILATGDCRILKADGDVFAYSRRLRSGKDVFGRSLAGPGRVICAVNRSGERRTVKLGPMTLDLNPFSALIQAQGETLKRFDFA